MCGKLPRVGRRGGVPLSAPRCARVTDLSTQIFLRYKSEVADAIRHSPCHNQAKINSEPGCKVRFIRGDNDVHRNGSIKAFADSLHIFIEPVEPYNHEGNSLVERAHRIVLDGSLARLVHANLPNCKSL